MLYLHYGLTLARSWITKGQCRALLLFISYFQNSMCICVLYSMFLFFLCTADNTRVGLNIFTGWIWDIQNILENLPSMLAYHGKHNNNTQDAQLRFSSVCILMRRTSRQCPGTTEVEGQNKSYSGSGSPGAWHIQRSTFKKQTNKKQNNIHTRTLVIELNTTLLSQNAQKGEVCVVVGRQRDQGLP